MKHLILSIAFIPFITLYSQKTMPGGVQGAFVWEITEGAQTGNAQWKSNLKSTLDTELILKGKIKTINNNPALYFTEGDNTINNTLNLGKLEDFSLFTVCQEEDTILEKVIFSLENDTAPEMVLTNRRMAALDAYCYANYNTNKKQFPKIYSYTQNKSKDSAIISRRLQFGHPPRSQHLPVSAYSGIIPEVILFNRYLSPKERQKVESYLALKYGISLNQQFQLSYLNSSGEVIWDACINAAFNQNIAGIGRDDLSGLNQQISENTQTPGVMKIGFMGELKNNSFLTWGDNNRPLRFADESGIRKLQREWKISAFNLKNDSVYFETNALSLNEIDPLQEGEIYWMMIDKSGTGKYPFGQTEYVQCLPMSSRGIIHFNPVVIDTDRSGNDVFTLLAAPLFFTRSVIKSPACTSLQSGLIQTEIAGGTPPFELTLSGITNSSFKASEKEDKTEHIFEGIEQGAYILQVTDANKNSYSEKVWVSNTHLWETRICENYKLVEGETITLDASDKMPAADYTYSWTEPDGSVVNNEILTISQPGDYLLSVIDDNGCNSTLKINVKLTGKVNFNNIELFPNPSKGWFSLRMSLERISDVKVVITDISGKFIKQTLLQNDQYYWYTDKMHQTGIYFITLISGSEKETLKLIIQ